MALEAELKKYVRRFVAILAYYVGLDALMYKLNRNAKRILTFHNVLPDALMRDVPNIGCMECVSVFEGKIHEVGKRFGFSTDLDDPSTVTITFDDGMINEYEIAGEVLRRLAIPAILFVAGDVVDVPPQHTLITDKILLWNRFAPDWAVQKVFGTIVSREKLWMHYIQPAYREDGMSRGKCFLSRLESVVSIESILKTLPPEWVRLRLSGVTTNQLDDLRRRGWLIGWHTKSHYPLGSLDESAKRQELESPEEYRSVVLSYPYGDIGSIGADSMKIAEEVGFPCALSNGSDYSPFCGRYFGQRMTLSDNKYELHMLLSGLKYFIKYRRRLPRVYGV